MNPHPQPLGERSNGFFPYLFSKKGFTRNIISVYYQHRSIINIYPDSVIGNTSDSGSGLGGSSPPRDVYYGGVAQLVEFPAHIRFVRGSSPFATKNQNPRLGEVLFFISGEGT